MEDKRVLFLCTGNTARSQMAEAFLRKHAGDHFEAFSAGLKPGAVHPYTEQVMREIGIDISGQYSKSVKEYFGKMSFAYLVTVCAKAEANCPSTFPSISNRVRWTFDDPVALEGSDEEKLQKFREVRDEIENRILQWLREEEFLKK